MNTPSDATFVFADIAGFTALTEAHGDEHAADLVAQFCDTVRGVLPDYDAEPIKSIGDAMLIRVPHPAPAIRLGTRIAHELMTAHGAPSVRVGMHHGPAVERDGDYFGATVNLAARVSSVAGGGEVLLTATTGALAGDLDDVVYEPRGRHHLRNVRAPVELLAALRVGAPGREGLVVDPVCKMVIDPDRAVGRLTHNALTHFFCTLECAGEFARRPDDFSD
jgi:class 3 adenylate cyclase/YHS domain-containing protein